MKTSPVMELGPAQNKQPEVVVASDVASGSVSFYGVSVTDSSNTTHLAERRLHSGGAGVGQLGSVKQQDA